MKYIVTVVRPERLQAVKEALFRVGVTGMTLSRVSGHGGEHEVIEQYRGRTVIVTLSGDLHGDSSRCK